MDCAGGFGKNGDFRVFSVQKISLMVPNLCVAEEQFINGNRKQCSKLGCDLPQERNARAKAMEKKRKILLDFLNSEGTGDNEADHSTAEDLLLDLVGDPEITAAWKNTPQTWWYA